MLRSRAFVLIFAFLFVFNSTTPSQAVIVLFENFNDDADNDATDAPFVKADVDTSPTSFFHDTGDNYWGIYDPVGMQNFL